MIDFQGVPEEIDEIEPANDYITNDQGQTYPARLGEFAAAEGDISHLFTEEELAEIGHNVVDDWERDDAERADWKADVEKALNQAAQEPKEPKTYPFEGASNVNYPILTVASQQFAARAYPAIVKGDQAVRVKVLGSDKSGDKAARAKRVSDYLNYILFYQMEDWEADVDVLLNQTPIIGMGFKKVYYDPRRGPVSDYVNALRLTVPKDTTSLERCPRVTQDFDQYPYEIASRQRSGIYRQVDLPSTEEDAQKPRLLLEQHRLDDLDGDGVEEPYIVTVDKETCEVLRIEAAFTDDDVGFGADGSVVAVKRWMPFVEFPFLPDPKGGFYAIGLGKLLESITAVINTAINMLLDAGHAQVAGGGFIFGGLRLQGAGQGSTIRMRPGEYKTINAPAGAAGSIHERTLPQPSAVLFSLLDLLLGAAKDISSVKDVLTGDTPATAPVGTTLALIEQGLQQFTSIYKRIYRSERTEFQKLYECVQKWGSEQAYAEFFDDPEANFRQDFSPRGNDIMPVSDPTVVTRAQALAKAQFAAQFMGTGVMNDAEVVLEALRAAEIDEPERLMKPPMQGPPPGFEEEMAKTKSETMKNETQAVLNMAKAGQATGETIVERGLPGVAGSPGDEMGVPGPDGGLGGPEDGMGAADLGGGLAPGPVAPDGVEDAGGQLPVPV